MSDDPEALIFDLPMPPSTNRIWRIAGSGKFIVKSPEYRKWSKRTAALAGILRRRSFVSGYFSAEILVPTPEGRHCDLDNVIKPTLDAIVAGGAVVDDKFCVRVSAEWRDGIPRGDVRVIIRPARAPDGGA